jgi:hypothetical protein
MPAARAKYAQDPDRTKNLVSVAVCSVCGWLIVRDNNVEAMAAAEAHSVRHAPRPTTRPPTW